VTVEAIEARLAGLESRAGFGIEQFDDGGAIAGRLAVLPSAFNPPTRAHVELMRLGARVTGGAAAAVLTTSNVDKGLHGASLGDRVGMLLAGRSEWEYAVLASNAARIVDQAKALLRWNPGLELTFLMGHDTLVRLFEPRYYEDMGEDLGRFFARCRVVATNRGQVPLEEVREFVRRPGPRRFSDRIDVRELDEHPASLSSTAARGEIAARGEALAVVPAVGEYIRRHGLYRDQAGAGDQR
jgi:nicotinamide-nucleotide adenylyltransferase